MPAPLPAVNRTLEANDAVRYYENVCEYGYRDGERDLGGKCSGSRTVD